MTARKAQIICFSYHKSGTSLLYHVMTRVSEKLGLKLANQYGLVEQPDPDADIVLLPHSLLFRPISRPYKAVRMIRDPRDIWVSGYLYHLRCDELWCVNADLNPVSPIGWPHVDYSIAHWPLDAKQRYMIWLGGRSYQQNLKDRGREEGLGFELEGYTSWTLAAMKAWSQSGLTALDVKIEDAMADFDQTMLRIFSHFGFTPEQCRDALDVARFEDIRRMDDATIAKRPQISSRAISKWQTFLRPDQVARFEARYGDAIKALGYQVEGGTSAGGVSGSWQARLLVDQSAVRPIAQSGGTFTFVVPRGCKLVQLTALADDRAEDGAMSHYEPIGLAVQTITVQASAEEWVITADDPRLIEGWCEPQRAGAGLFRWTSGPAKLPCAGLPEAVVVTVRCLVLPAYRTYEAAVTKEVA